MKPILTYWDYREYLKDYYEERKSSDAFFSYRFIGTKTDLDAGFLVRIFQGQGHLSGKSVDTFVAFLHLSGREEEYFRCLVDFCKARTDKSRARHYSKLLEIQGFQTTKLAKDQLALFQQWQHIPIRSLIALKDSDTSAASLGNRLSPSLPPSEAEASIALLLRLGLLRTNNRNALELTDTYISAGPEQIRPVAIREFQRETMKLAMESLERHPPELRDISSVSVTLNPKDLPIIRDRIKTLRESILKFSSESTGEREVFQLNMQLFPLTLRKGTEA